MPYDGHEKLHIGNEIMQQYGLPNYIGIMDGTLLKLQYAPLLHPENYHSEKGVNAVQALLVCDHRCRINHVYVGWSCMTTEYGGILRYFAISLLSDSAYTVDVHISM